MPLRSSLLISMFGILACHAVTLQTDDPRESFTQTLGGVLQAAQLGLKKAENQQEKAVQQVRQQAQDVISSEALSMGEAVGQYFLQLEQVAQDLEAQVNSSRKVLDAAEAADHSNAFAGPEVESRSKVSVQLEVAARLVRSTRRQQEHLVEQAQRSAELSLEDNADTLSRRVGDLSTIVDQAKTSLQDIVENREARKVAPSNSSSSSTTTNSTPSKADMVSRMNALAAYVKSAQAASKARLAASGQNVTTSIANADKELAAKVKEMAANLVASEQVAINGLKTPLETKAAQLRGSSKAKKQKAAKKQTTKLAKAPASLAPKPASKVAVKLAPKTEKMPKQSQEGKH
jgi:hypothetical protein